MIKVEPGVSPELAQLALPTNQATFALRLQVWRRLPILTSTQVANFKEGWIGS